MAEGIAGDDLEQLHNLLLVDDDAVSVFEDGLENRVEVFNPLGIVFVLDVDRDLFERTWTIERHHGVDVFDAGRFEFT